MNSNFRFQFLVKKKKIQFDGKFDNFLRYLTDKNFHENEAEHGNFGRNTDNKSNLNSVFYKYSKDSI